MTAKHTPGPWAPLILDKPLAEIPAYVEKCIGAGPGAEFFFVLSEQPDGPVDVCHIGNGQRREANARLISAAPEMLEALRVAKEFMEIASDWNIDEAEIGGEMRSTYDWLDVIRSAIAKAEGEQA